jgi:hypothetical protein
MLYSTCKALHSLINGMKSSTYLFFSDEPLTERQQKLFVNELAKHIPRITWEQYETYKAKKEKEAQAIIEARKKSFSFN